MPDKSTKKVPSGSSSKGPHGQHYLAAGQDVSMRLWDEAPGEARDKGPHTHDYEVAGYVIAGEATLHLGSEQLALKEGDSWIVPSGVEHTYRIEKSFKAVEATSPPARDS